MPVLISTGNIYYRPEELRPPPCEARPPLAEILLLCSGLIAANPLLDEPRDELPEEEPPELRPPLEPLEALLEDAPFDELPFEDDFLDAVFELLPPRPPEDDEPPRPPELLEAPLDEPPPELLLADFFVAAFLVAFAMINGF